MGTSGVFSTSLLLILLTVVDGQGNYFPYNRPPMEYSQRKYLSAGDSCSLPSSVPAVCTPSSNCRQASANGLLPVVCSYSNFVTIVCCPVDKLFTNQNDRTTSTTKPAVSQLSLTPYSGGSFQTELKSSANQVGRRSARACEEYYRRLKSMSGNAAKESVDTNEVQPTQLPHMALIGFGKKNNIYWRCSGALISPRFIISPGHCVASRRHGAAKWVMLGVVDPYDASLPSEAQLFSIEDRLPVPNFSPPSLHNDLAVVKLDHDARFTPHVMPACLSPKRPPVGVTATVPGWELNNWIITPGKSHLKQVTLEVVPPEKCADAYQSTLFRLDGRYDAKHLLCLGNNRETTSNCERDTGGPFHTRTPENLYVISSVVLFGNTVCERRNNTPVISTDVVEFLSYLEDTVWPNQ